MKTYNTYLNTLYSILSTYLIRWTQLRLIKPRKEQKGRNGIVRFSLDKKVNEKKAPLSFCQFRLQNHENELSHFASCALFVVSNLSLNLSIFLLLFITACNDFLDHPEPTDVLPIEVAIQTEKDLEQALLGAYAFFRVMDVENLISADLLADNSQWIGIANTGAWRELNNLQITPFNNSVCVIWEWSYKTINQSNLVLQKLDEIEGLDPIFVSQAQGEALFLRGITYFHLVRYFAIPYGPTSDTDPGVPILTNPTLNTEAVTFPTRASVKAVYEQAISDLTEASKLLVETNEPYRAHRLAAIAYLARIAFQQRDYMQAANLANEIVQSDFQLTSQPQEIFLQEGSLEEIWFTPFTPQERGGLAWVSQTPNMLLSADLSLNGFSSILSTKQQDALQALHLEAWDLRQTNMTVASPQPDNLMAIKYEDRANGGDDGPHLRLAEFMLIRAEALVHNNGVNQESLDLLNRIRTRSLRVQDSLGQEISSAISMIEFQLDDFASTDELIDAIVAERRVELFLEGNRFHDLMRLQRSVQGLPYDTPRLRLPIPQAEIDANSKLVQNEGY